MSIQQTVATDTGKFVAFYIADFNDVQLAILEAYDPAKLEIMHTRGKLDLDMTETLDILLSLLLRLCSDEEALASELPRPRNLAEAALLVSHHLMEAMQLKAA